MHSASIGAAFLFQAAMADSGIAVSCHSTRIELEFIKGTYGQIWRHTVTDDRVTGHTMLHAGPAFKPVISPDGRQIAFLKCDSIIKDAGTEASARIVVMSINGGVMTELTTTNALSSIHWPGTPASMDWIYYSNGSEFQAPASGLLRRVNVQSKKVDTLFKLIGGDGKPCGIADFGIAADLRHLVIRPPSNSGWGVGRQYAYDMQTDNGKIDFSHATDPNKGMYSCCPGISCDATYIMCGHYYHVGHRVRRWSDLYNGRNAESDEVLLYWRDEAVKWGPVDATPDANSANPMEGNMYHSAYMNKCSVNSPRWFILNVGADLLLDNWQDKKCINLTHNVWKTADENTYDLAGDYWVSGISATEKNVSLQMKPLIHGRSAPRYDIRGRRILTPSRISASTHGNKASIILLSNAGPAVVIR
jgi:hypothetical protein